MWTANNSQCGQPTTVNVDSQQQSMWPASSSQCGQPAAVNVASQQQSMWTASSSQFGQFEQSSAGSWLKGFVCLAALCLTCSSAFFLYALLIWSAVASFFTPSVAYRSSSAHCTGVHDKIPAAPTVAESGQRCDRCCLPEQCGTVARLMRPTLRASARLAVLHISQSPSENHSCEDQADH